MIITQIKQNQLNTNLNINNLAQNNSNRININYYIKAPQLRVIDQDGNNIGVISNEEAQKMARAAELDLIEISASAVPPIAKIMDYGKFQYDENKKQKASKATVKTVEIKSIQVKIGTGENDLNMKARRASEWLDEGHQVKAELFVSGRSKFLPEEFLNARLQKFLNLISVDYKVSVPIKRGPKGPVIVIEKKK
ncbi:translation initiation factor IF-3 [Candidatus Parcubacteria bacterium]|nr:translation initiation factor IF-3 [Candidatus Parcubacteria bacterium]